MEKVEKVEKVEKEEKEEDRLTDRSPISSVIASKKISAYVWLARETPMKMRHFMSLLSLIGATTPNFRHLEQLVTSLGHLHSE